MAWADLQLSDYLALTALIVSLLRYKNLRKVSLKGFMPYLSFTIAVEWGAASGVYMVNGSDHWIFNIQTTIESCFFFFLFYKTLKNPVAKRLAWFSVLLFPFAIAVNCLLLRGFNELATYAIILGSLLTIAFACTYFYQLLQTATEMKFFAIPFFWISTGLLFYNAGDFVNMAIFTPLIHSKDKTFVNIFHAIEYTLNTLLYGCFIIAFLCQRKTTNSFT